MIKQLIKQPTCNKRRDNPTCIDLMHTNLPFKFQGTCLLEKRLSNFHLIALTIMRRTLKVYRSSSKSDLW